MWIKYNANPNRRTVGDCVIRAISKALGQSWDETFIGICETALRLKDMPSSNAVWGAYLREHGYNRYVIPNDCPDCYTVADFCEDNPHGTFVLALSGHVVAVQDGCVYDTWNSLEEIPIYYWMKG